VKEGVFQEEEKIPLDIIGSPSSQSNNDAVVCTLAPVANDSTPLEYEDPYWFGGRYLDKFASTSDYYSFVSDSTALQEYAQVGYTYL
jgi:hypothetical protein